MTQALPTEVPKSKLQGSAAETVDPMESITAQIAPKERDPQQEQLVPFCEPPKSRHAPMYSAASCKRGQTYIVSLPSSPSLSKSTTGEIPQHVEPATTTVDVNPVEQEDPPSTS